jgi:signal transduction histidine kinase/CheY-like chemotaxis protein
VDRSRKLHILHIEDDEVDAELIRQTLLRSDLGCDITLAMSRNDYQQALERGGIDLILSDNRGYDFDGLEVLRTVRRQHPQIPFLFLSGSYEGKDLQRLKDEGAADCVLKSDTEALVPAIQRALDRTAPAAGEIYQRGLERLVKLGQQLPLACELGVAVNLVCRAAREIAGADAAVFLLREGEHCRCVGEDSAGPQWKGQLLPMDDCVNGWSMRHREVAVIEDIHSDPRISKERARGMSMQSMVTVPVRLGDPVGSIACFWKSRHRPSDAEVGLLEALADAASAALENVRRFGVLTQQLEERGRDLEAVNRELESFSYSVSHDLRGPLRSVTGFGKLLAKDYEGKLDEAGKNFLNYVTDGTQRIAALVDALLELSRVSRAKLEKQPVDLSALAEQVVVELRRKDPGRKVEVMVESGMWAEADPRLTRIVLENLLGNAWKFTSKRAEARIEMGRLREGGEEMFYVKDDGDGFEMAYADKLFTPFQRQHRQDEFEGAGVGLASVQRIVMRHGGRIRAEAAEGEGATFYFTLEPASRD